MLNSHPPDDLWREEVPYEERTSFIDGFKNTRNNIRESFPPVKPFVKLNSKHIFCFLIYMIIQSLFLFIMTLVTRHYIFTLVNFFSTTLTTIVVWSKISYISNKKENTATTI